MLARLHERTAESQAQAADAAEAIRLADVAREGDELDRDL